MQINTWQSFSITKWIKSKPPSFYAERKQALLLRHGIELLGWCACCCGSRISSVCRLYRNDAETTYIQALVAAAEAEYPRYNRLIQQLLR